MAPSFSKISPYLFLTKRGVQIIAAVSWFKDKVGDLRWCEGPSMLPTLNVTGDLLLQIPLSSIFNFNLNQLNPSFKSKEIDYNLKKTFINHQKYHNPTLQKNLNRGDVINFISPLNPSVLACKRILALPGDQILVDLDHHFHLNPNTNLDLLQKKNQTHHTQSLLTIPEGHLWLQGDNCAVSIDSRTYGPVPIALVSGKIVARVWPNFTWLSQPFKYHKLSKREF